MSFVSSFILSGYLASLVYRIFRKVKCLPYWKCCKKISVLHEKIRILYLVPLLFYIWPIYIWNLMRLLKVANNLIDILVCILYFYMYLENLQIGQLLGSTMSQTITQILSNTQFWRVYYLKSLQIQSGEKISENYLICRHTEHTG